MSDTKTIQQATRDKRAQMDQFRVKRDGEGKLIPLEQPTEFGKVMVLPMTYGDAEEWGMKMADQDSVSAEDLAGQFRKHIVGPDMSKVTGKEIKEEFLPLAVQELIMAVMGASGMEEQIKASMNADGTAKIEVTGKN